MFGLTLVDHLRMTFGQVVYRSKAHAELARSSARWSRWLKAVEALLMSGVLAATIGTAFGKDHAYAVMSAMLAGLALITLLLHLTFDLDRSAQLHASCATRLWQIRELYRALLSDFTDGALDLDAVRQRRDGLMNELREIYETAPLADARVHPSAALTGVTADEPVLTDEEIDLFLPKSLRKDGKPTAA